MSKSPRRGPTVGYYVLAPLLASLVTLLLIECGLAILRPVPFSIERNMYFEPDPYTGYRLRPHGMGHFQNGIPAVANSQGHRDDEVSVAKLTGVFRILVLGDSFTVGANVRQEEAYPQVLERLLNQIALRPVEVVNTAVGGWDPFQYAQYYEHYARIFHPDLVYVGFFVGNDTYSQAERVEQRPTAVLGRRVSREAAVSRGTTVRVWLTEHSHLARLLLLRGPKQEFTHTRKTCDQFSEDYLAIQSSRMPNHLKRAPEREAAVQSSIRQIRRIQRMAQEDSSRLVVALLPDENQVNPALQKLLVPVSQRDQYDFRMPQAMLAEMLGEMGIPTIDLLRDFQNDPRCLYMNDTHWTPEGHALAAKIIAEHLKSYLQ